MAMYTYERIDTRVQATFKANSKKYAHARALVDLGIIDKPNLLRLHRMAGRNRSGGHGGPRKRHGRRWDAPRVGETRSRFAESTEAYWGR